MTDNKDETKDFEDVELKTGIDPLFFAETITTDVELVDAIYDLIDNSIDAARNIIIARQDYKPDKYGLPSDYSGYEITLEFSPDSISIQDNCLGIDSDVIENRALYTGKKSSHKYGIGHYGLGLKRALLKTGTRFSLQSDNGESLYIAEFEHDVLSGDKDKRLMAKKYISNGKVGTIFTAFNLKQDVIDQIRSNEWLENTTSHLSLRYSIFIDKGLKITLKNYCFSTEITREILAGLPKIREDRLLSEKEDYLSADKVSVFFNVGCHEKYRFSGEQDHNSQVNKSVTEQFGIYFLCNDRVIVCHSFEKRHGFTAAFHSEHNGFLCYVRMVAVDPGLLPWNTAKTEIKVHNPLFIKTKNMIEPLALDYRSKAKAIINVWLNEETKHLPQDKRKNIFQQKLSPNNNPNLNVGNTKSSSPQSNLFGGQDSHAPPKLNSPKNNPSSAHKNKERHTSSWSTLLPKYFPISSSDHVLDNMLIEATGLTIDQAAHSASMLYRSLLEGSLKHYAEKSGNYKAVLEHYYDKGEGKKKGHNDEYKKNKGIDLSMALHWLLDNKELFPESKRKTLDQNVKHARSHVKKMNGVVHCKELISATEVVKIRNETIMLLEFLVTIGVAAN